MSILSEINRLPLISPRPTLKADRRGLERRGPSRPPVPGESDERRASRERRATPRLECELECEERVGTSRYFRITRDLSPFGVSTRAGLPHPKGTRFELVLYLPDQLRNPLHLQAEVVGWNNEGQGMRLAFRNPPGEAVRRIHQYLKAKGQLARA